MGLGVGIMQWEPVEVPDEVVYDFAWEMLHEGVGSEYMAGESQSYIPYTQRQVERMLRRFARSKGLTREERLAIRAWLKSLPWIGGWQSRLPRDDRRDQDYGYWPVVDNDDGRDGGIIELHFSW